MIRGLLAELRDHHGVAERLPGGSADTIHAVQLSSRWEGRNVWAVFRERADRPDLIVKVDHAKRYQKRLRREHRALLALAERPELRGLVPEPLALHTSGPRLVLAQAGLPGRSLAVAIRRRLRASPRAARRDHARVLDWLARYQAAMGPGEHRRLRADDVLGLADRTLDGAGPALTDHLSRLATRWDGLDLPLLAGHGDLGPSNCLVDGSRTSVIDWEGGCGHRTPIADLVVFLHHYARMQTRRHGGPPRRDGGFRRAFLGGDWLADLSARSFLGQLERFGLPTAAGEYLLLATLVELAAGEAPTTHAAGAARRYWRPFLRSHADPLTASSVRRALGNAP